MTSTGGPGARARRSERGVSSLEMLGIMLVAGSVIGALAFTVGSESVGDKAGTAFCAITAGDCGPGGGGATTSPGDDTCVGAPPGAAGPVRGLVPLSGSRVSAVGVMGDGTFQVYAGSSGSGGGSTSPAANDGWVSRHLSPGAAAGVEPFLTGRAHAVYAASGPADLADLVAADARQGWSDSVFGTGTSRLGAAASALGDAVLSGVGGGESLPAPTATFDDTSAAAGLSLNAYAQTVAMDSGGEAVGVVRHASGATTEVVGVSESTTSSADVLPMLLHVDRDPSGNVVAVRTVTDRDLSDPTSGATSSLYVTHLDTTAGSAQNVVRSFADSIGAVDLGGARLTPGADGSTSGGSTTGSPGGTDGATVGGSDGSSDGTSAAADFVAAALRDGYVNRQQPSGTVPTTGSGVDAIESGLRRVSASPAPEAFNGNDWTARVPGCRG
ncbi:hypothetical protein ACOCJ5_07990 [Knoellia sp. CPCC 206450]|uniref:hypothetical protein n=1 Tax=Knoellia tibetensis TaxID=3404798 RepID=UPI003B43BF72